MNKFRVGVREVHVHFYDVECDTEEEAKRLVDDFDDQVIDTDFVEYSHNLRTDTWSVEVL
jgi:hypothetical protein